MSFRGPVFYKAPLPNYGNHALTAYDGDGPDTWNVEPAKGREAGMTSRQADQERLTLDTGRFTLKLTAQGLFRTGEVWNLRSPGTAEDESGGL